MQSVKAFHRGIVVDAARNPVETEHMAYTKKHEEHHGTPENFPSHLDTIYIYIIYVYHIHFVHLIYIYIGAHL